MRIDLNVPFHEKDQAKLLGAKWDGIKRIWYVENKENLQPFRRWVPPHYAKIHQKSTDMDADMLRRLIQLCHPDKHNGSEASIKATQWLLSKKASQ